MRDGYAPAVVDEGYAIPETVQRRYVAKRDAKTFLPFLLPHLRAGLDILDAGCGVGSIALDLAPNVAPGRIFGIDIDSGQIEVARRLARERGVNNAQFDTASVYQLPFSNETFDAVYSVAVLQHVSDRVRALTEMRRVLRPGGLAAVTDDDQGTVAMSPDRPELRLGLDLIGRLFKHGGGDARYSRHLRSLMLEAGFVRTQGVAHAPEVYGDPMSTHWWTEFVADFLGAPSASDVIISEGWASQAELDGVIAALGEWGRQPDAFVGWLYCGALGWTS